MAHQTTRFHPSVLSYIRGEELSEEDKKRRGAERAWYGIVLSKGKSSVVKEMCAESDDGKRKTMFCTERKLWGTLRLKNVISLVLSGLWEPVGVAPSLAEDVAKCAKSFVEEEESQARAKMHEVERAQRAERERKTQEAMEKERLRREKDQVRFSEPDFEEALDMFGLRREVVEASASWPWLGPRTNDPMNRIRRYFSFSHNKQRGVDAVRRDFEGGASESSATTSATSATSTSDNQNGLNGLNGPNGSKFRPQKRKGTDMQLERERAMKLAKAADDHDEHARALKHIQTAFVPTITFPRSQKCPRCGVKPLVQFLDCGCSNDSYQSWKVCQRCNTLYHPERTRCLCDI